MPIKHFEELGVWQKAKSLTVSIYRISGTGGFSRDFALKDQIRRAAISVMSKVAEGFERYSRREFMQFLSIARGSASEVRSQLHLAHELRYVSDDEFRRLSAECVEVGRMLAALRATISLKRPSARGGGTPR